MEQKLDMVIKGIEASADRQTALEKAMEWEEGEPNVPAVHCGGPMSAMEQFALGAAASGAMTVRGQQFGIGTGAGIPGTTQPVMQQVQTTRTATTVPSPFIHSTLTQGGPAPAALCVISSVETRKSGSIPEGRRCCCRSKCHGVATRAN